MPKFRVQLASEPPDHGGFVLSGTVVDGDIRAGMFVRVSFNWRLWLPIRIENIEVSQRDGGDQVSLCLDSQPDEADLLRGLDLRGQLLTLTEDET